VHKNYVNLENFSHKLIIIFLEDGKMASPYFLFLGTGKMVLHIWFLHHGCSIPCDHMVSPKGLSNGTQRHVMQHTCSEQQSVIGIKDICPRDRDI
jgi:hypothetical protein